MEDLFGTVDSVDSSVSDVDTETLIDDSTDDKSVATSVASFLKGGGVKPLSPMSSKSENDVVVDSATQFDFIGADASIDNNNQEVSAVTEDAVGEDKPKKRKAGRPKGSKNRKTIYAEKKAALDAQKTPFDEYPEFIADPMRPKRGRPRKNANIGNIPVVSKIADGEVKSQSKDARVPYLAGDVDKSYRPVGFENVVPVIGGVPGVSPQMYPNTTATATQNPYLTTSGMPYYSQTLIGDKEEKMIPEDDSKISGKGGKAKRKHQKNEPSISKEMLLALALSELRKMAQDFDVDFTDLKKPELIDAIFDAVSKREGFSQITGVLEINPEQFGFVRADSYSKSSQDAYVSHAMIKQYELRKGDRVTGTIRPAASSKQYAPLVSIETINDISPELSKLRPRFRDLVPIFPNEPLIMETTPDELTGRAIDIVAPIGKGQRGLIVSPPKAGKTTVLKHLCQAITKNNPEVHLICLLVDERPEEVTDMQRSIDGIVVASTFDMPPENHTRIAELVIERAKRIVEGGGDVVVVLDSITRLARAYNLAAPPSGRILSGGVDSAALYPPKRFLGAARNIEGGGSLTILASALVDTGSKMDEVIFEEFKGTGNMELKLDRDLADKRIFPAIDPVSSGTRNEDLLLDKGLSPLIWGLRRVLANINNTERAEASLIKGLKQTKNNREFLIRSAKRSQSADITE